MKVAGSAEQWCMVFEGFHIMAIAVGFEFFILGYAG